MASDAMNYLELELRYQSNSVRQQVCGLMIPAADFDAWVDAICRLCNSLDVIRMVQIRPVQSDSRPNLQSVQNNQEQANGNSSTGCGLTGDVFFYWQDGLVAQEFRSKIVSGEKIAGGLWFRSMSERLMVPVDSEFSVPLADFETRAWLADYPGYILVWHPRCGLLKCTQESFQSIPALVQVKSYRAVAWGDVRPGQHLNPHIQWIRPKQESDVAELLSDGRDDIGSSGGKFDELPPGPTESQSSAKPVGPSSLRKWIARHAANSLSMFSAVRKWAQGVRDEQRAVEQNAIEDQRNNEIQRLMDMLERDPDAGLKYALPMASDSKDARRAARPNGRLGENTSDFDRNRLNSKGDSDPWVVSWETHAKLIQRYRELAQREMRLGRHRRAAYIYAHLLNDLESAAWALKAGSHFHDAALLYLEKLSRPVIAAECFREGGFWEEALQIYVNHQRWIPAADLAVRLNRPQESNSYVRKRIDELMTTRNYSEAGQLADERVNDPELAAAVWHKGWRSDAVNGRKCFEHLLAMHARRGNHRESMGCLQEFADSALNNGVPAAIALSVCTHAANNYPDQHINDFARQLSWKLAELAVSGSNSASREAALKDVSRLARFDRLLDRDTQRFAALASRQKIETRPAPVSASRVRRLALVTSFHPFADHFAHPAARKVRWRQVLTNHSYFFALGTNPDGDQVLIRKSLENLRDADPQKVSAFVFQSSDNFPLEKCVLRLCTRHPERVWLHVPGTGEQWTMNSIRCVAGVEPFFRILPVRSEIMLDFCQAATGTLFAVTVNSQNQLTISSFGDGGLEKESVNLLLPEEVLSNLADVRIIDTTRIIPRNDRLFIIAGCYVLPMEFDDCATLEISNVTGRDEFGRLMLPSPIHDVAIPQGTFSPRILLGAEQGAVCVNTGNDEIQTFANEMVAPKVGFTNHGIAVLACTSTRRIEAYNLNTSDGRPRIIGAVPELAGVSPIIGICPGNAPHHIHIVTENGACHQFMAAPV